MARNVEDLNMGLGNVYFVRRWNSGRERAVEDLGMGLGEVYFVSRFGFRLVCKGWEGCGVFEIPLYAVGSFVRLSVITDIACESIVQCTR